MFCHNCGNKIPDSSKFCHYCGAPQDTFQSASASAVPPPVQPVQPRPAVREDQAERVLPGILGALLCSLGGVAVMVVLFQMGYVASLSGIIMLGCTVWGYAHFGNAISKKGIVISVLIVIFMIYEGTRLCAAISLAGSFDGHSNFLGIILTEMTRFNNIFNLPEPQREYYYEILSQQYAFAAAGMIVMVINLFRGSRPRRENKR